jgi:hypothetical protein
VRASLRPLCLLIALCCVSTVSVGAAWAASPKTKCKASKTTKRVSLHVKLQDFLTPNLRQLMRLGLPGTVRIKARLMRSRDYWFDDTVASSTTRLGLRWREGVGLVLGTASIIRDIKTLSLPTISLGRGKKLGGSLYVEVEVQLRIITQSSLGKTRKWLKGATTSGSMGKWVMKQVVEDLSRSDGARCSARSTH